MEHLSNLPDLAWLRDATIYTVAGLCAVAVVAQAWFGYKTNVLIGNHTLHALADLKEAIRELARDIRKASPNE